MNQSKRLNIKFLHTFLSVYTWLFSFSLFAQIDKEKFFYLSSNQIANTSFCQYDTLKVVAHFKDTTYLHPFFRWESKMPNEAWLTEKTDTVRSMSFYPLKKGKVYRCIVDDTMTSEGLTFRKKIADPILPNVLPFPDIVLVPTASTCLLSNGKIELFTNSWTDKSTKQHLTDVSKGIYSVTVLDTKTGCKHSFRDTINNKFEPPKLFFNMRYAECGLKNGAIDLVVTGIDTPFVYKWNTGAEIEDLDKVGVGNYQVTVTNALGCSATEKVGISNIASPFRIKIESMDASCNKANGRLLCQVEGSGSPFEYQWNTGEKKAFLGQCAAGKYWVAVTNQYGCTDTAYRTIKALPPINADFAVTDVACYGAATGSIKTTLSVPDKDFVYEWNDGVKGKNRENLPAGDYFLKVKNADASCEIEAKASVKEPEKWQVETAIQAFEGNYFLIAKAMNGAAPVRYIWENTTENDTFLLKKTGTYLLTVIDAKVCYLMDSVVLSFENDESLYIPNFITPNTDQKNDDFSIKGSHIAKIEVVISDNVGNIVYEDAYSEIYWDASDCGGKDCEAGLYYYEAVIYYKNGERVEKKGSFRVEK